MTSKIKVDNINKVSDDSNIIKKCGTTTTIGSGASNPIVVDGSAVTLGRCGGTVALASGATQTGFGRTGTVDWQTAIKTTGFTAVSGEGYFCNTTGGAFIVTLPSSPSAGDIVAVSDYANTFDTGNLTLGRNSSNIEGAASDLVINKEGAAITVVYADSTKGWIVVNAGNSTNAFETPTYITATGGTVTCTGDFKIHTFTGPGTFEVTDAGNATGANTLEYLVIAGGGSGGSSANGSTYRGGGGGGAGGYRESSGAGAGSYTVSPLGSGVSGITASVTSYPITVGGGGAGSCNANNEGNNSTFSTITSAGGGGGGRDSANPNEGAGGGGQADNGGSGGGAAAGENGLKVKGAGNTPPVSPAQGKDGGGPAGPGGASSGSDSGSGGGGATVAGVKASDSNGGSGGTGATSNINNSPTARATGGGGGNQSGNGSGPAGSANTGNGGGGANGGPADTGGGTGGSGIVIIRYRFQE